MPSSRNTVLAGALAAGLAATVAPAIAETVDTPTVAIVTVPKPWYAPQWLVARKMRDTIPQYAQLPGLAYKMYSFAQSDGQFGGLYLWRSRAQAQAWFDPAWFERVARERGVPGRVRFFEAPVTIDTSPDGPPASSDSPASATLVLVPWPAGATREQLVGEALASAAQDRKVPGLLRKHLILTDDHRFFGGVYVWSDAPAGRRWFDAAWHDRVQRQWGAPAQLEWFDVPILLPSASAANRIEGVH